MENREKIVIDYFRLRLFLNKTNLRKNERTEIEFFILPRDEGRTGLFATLRGIRNPKSLMLCSKKENAPWEAAGFSEFIDLESFCADFLRRKRMDKTTYTDMQNAVIKLKAELRSLGIAI